MRSENEGDGLGRGAAEHSLNSSRSLQAKSVIYFIISLHLILQMFVRILQKLYTV